MCCTESSHRVVYEYNEDNNVSSITETVNGTTKTYSYTYDDDNRLISENADGITVTYTYDDLGRLTQKQTKNGDTVIKTDSYTFTASTVGTNGTSSQVASYNGYTYTYDGNGNILSVSDGTNTTTYQYDSANQLVRENNQAGGFTKVWTYDNAGNILSRNEYAYTTGDLGTATETVTYQYTSAKWGDMLRVYDGQNLTYDASGNLTSDGEYIYTWVHGRELASMSKGNTTWTYTYDANGMRTKRTNGTNTYEYVYDGSQLVQLTIETTGDYSLEFTYDASGVPLTVTANGYLYYYVTNLQGDVIGIKNSSGEQVVTYFYDAWGNVTATGTDPIRDLNPLLYRGYVYDWETGLYYVSSRYYDPEIGRWINADSLVSTGQGILGNNMFAYCLNNPVNYIDRDGTNAEALQWWATGMGWLPFADTALPIGDIIYVGGILLLGAIALASDQDYAPEISYDEADVAYGTPSPNNDDDDDDYYDDESNFGGRQKVGKNKGSAPGNNQAQNKQFRDATKGLTPDQQRIVHDKITGKGLGYHEIKAVIKDLFAFIIGLFASEE